MSLPVKPTVSYPMSIHRAHEVIRHLSAAYDDLKDLYEYECAPGDKTDPNGDIVLFKLTPQEEILLRKLTEGSITSTVRLAAAIRLEDSKAVRPENQIKVLLYRLRHKLAPYGAVITSYTGAGYKIEGLAEARKNARSNTKVAPAYKAGSRKKFKPQMFEEVLQLLRDEGPMTCSDILQRMKSPWEIKPASKYAEMLRRLKQARKQGTVLMSYEKRNDRRVSVWYICNT